MPLKNLPAALPSASRASLQATLTVGMSVGFAIGSAMWVEAVAAERTGIVEIASAIPANVPLPEVQSGPVQAMDAASVQAGPVQTAQLEWLFGQPRRQPEPPRDFNRNRTEDGKRYIYIQKRDVFGNPDGMQRVLAPNQQPNQVKRPSLQNDRLRMQTAEKLRAAPPPPPTNGPLLITVSLARQQITLYDQGIAVAESPISSGTRSRPTPTGVYSVIQKQWFHRSNMYSSAPMPYMQRLTWSGIALHGGELPGYAASHGCIRLPDQFAIRLWGTTKPGVRVIVTQGEVKPVEIAHATLFVPKTNSAPAITPQPIVPSVTPPAAPTIAPSRGPQAQHDVPAATPAPVGVAGADDEAPVAVNTSAVPASLMEEMENTVPAVAEIAIVRGGQGQSGVAPVSQIAEQAVASNAPGVRTASVTILRGGQPMEFQTVDMPPVPTDTLPASPLAGGQSADDQIADAEDVDDSERDDAPLLALPALKEVPVLLAYSGSDFMQFAARTQRRAQAEPAAAPVESAPARILRPGPVAIFISRKERRLYVRKGFEAVFDAPITITEPNGPMETYVFTATALTGTGEAFRWDVVALANQNTNKKALYDSNKSLRAATRVLDRIKVPADVAARVTDIIEVGATVIVTDGGPGSPRSLLPDSDFSVVTR